MKNLKLSREQLRRDFDAVVEYCKTYLLHPIEHIKHPIVIEWESAVVGMIAINLAYGILRCVSNFHWLNAMIGLIVTPLMAATVLLLTTLFLYYFFQISFEKTFPFRKISSLLFISYLPASLFFVGSALYPPLFLLGLVVLAALLTVGLVENFQVPRKTVLTLVACGFFLAVVFWVFDQMYGSKATIEPKSLDELEREIGQFATPPTEE